MRGLLGPAHLCPHQRRLRRRVQRAGCPKAVPRRETGGSGLRAVDPGSPAGILAGVAGAEGGPTVPQTESCLSAKHTPTIAANQLIAHHPLQAQCVSKKAASQASLASWDRKCPWRRLFCRSRFAAGGRGVQCGLCLPPRGPGGTGNLSVQGGARSSEDS